MGFVEKKPFRGNPNQAPNLKKWQLKSAARKWQLKSAVRKWRLESAVERCMEEQNSCECIRKKIDERRGSGCAECFVCVDNTPEIGTDLGASEDTVDDDDGNGTALD